MKVNAETPDLIQFHPENDRETDFLRDLFGVYKYLRGPIMVYYGDVTVDGKETDGWKVTRYPARAVPEVPFGSTAEANLEHSVIASEHQPWPSGSTLNGLLNRETVWTAPPQPFSA